MKLPVGEWSTFRMDRTQSRPLAPPHARASRWEEGWAALKWAVRSWVVPADADATWEQDG